MKFYLQAISKKTLDITEKVVAEYEGVYCDMLEETFTSDTGLYANL